MIRFSKYVIMFILLSKVVAKLCPKCFNKMCNMHLSFKNLNPSPTKNLLSIFQNLYIYTNSLSIEFLSIVAPRFFPRGVSNGRARNFSFVMRGR